jgi:acetoacetate decarboxylase
MAIEINGNSGFSMPFGASLYPAPPHHFLGAKNAWARYEADPKAVASLLPPGVVVDDPCICELWVCDYPSTTFGPYLEAYIHVRVKLDGVAYWYLPIIYTDREPALAAGREIWGYPKKLATMEWREEAEQIIFTIERPVGKRLVTFTISRDRLAEPKEVDRLPILSLRFIPQSDPDRKPAAAELVRLDVVGGLHTTPVLGNVLWAGRSSVSIDSPSNMDPWHLFQPIDPTKIQSGFVQTVNFSLPLGKVVKDYLAEGYFDKPAKAQK